MAWSGLADPIPLTAFDATATLSPRPFVLLAVIIETNDYNDDDDDDNDDNDDDLKLMPSWRKSMMSIVENHWASSGSSM